MADFRFGPGPLADPEGGVEYPAHHRSHRGELMRDRSGLLDLVEYLDVPDDHRVDPGRNVEQVSYGVERTDRGKMIRTRAGCALLTRENRPHRRAVLGVRSCRVVEFRPVAGGTQNALRQLLFEERLDQRLHVVRGEPELLPHFERRRTV